MVDLPRPTANTNRPLPTLLRRPESTALQSRQILASRFLSAAAANIGNVRSLMSPLPMPPTVPMPVSTGTTRPVVFDRNRPSSSTSTEKSSTEKPTIEKSSIEKSDREVLATGVVWYGFSDFRCGRSRTRIRLPNGRSPNWPSNLTERDHAKYFGGRWTLVSQIDARWSILQQSNPSVALIQAKECGAGGDCMYKSIACSLNILFEQNADPVDPDMIRSMAADQLNETTLPEFMMTCENISWYSNATVDKQLAAARSFVLKRGEFGQICALNLLLHSPLARKLNLGFAVISLRNRPNNNNTDPPSDESIPDPFVRRSRRLLMARTTPIATTQVIRRADTRHLMLLLNVHVGTQDCHYMALGVAPAVGIEPDVAFPIDSYPAALLPYLRESTS